MDTLLILSGLVAAASIYFAAYAIFGDRKHRYDAVLAAMLAITAGCLSFGLALHFFAEAG